MKNTSSQFRTLLRFKIPTRLLATLLLIGALPLLPKLQAQRFDIATCVGGDGNVACDKSDVFGAVQYLFPQVFNCNADDLTSAVIITPSDAGEVVDIITGNEISGTAPKVCIKWFKGGFHEVKVIYHCGLGYLETRTKTIYVSFSNVNYANFTVSAVSNCPAPYSQFTVTRTISANSGPVRQNRVLLYEIDGSNNITGSPVFDTGWRNGDFTSEKFDKGNGNINFEAGKRYKVRFQTQSACGSNDVTGSTIITGLASTAPAPDFTINGSSTFPADLYSCNNAPMILNDATVFAGCNPFLTTARIEIERASDCNSSISGTKLTQTVSYASSYNLRTLFPTYTSTADLYRITYSIQGITGLLVGPTHCVRVNSLDASNAEFLLKAPNNGMPLSRTTTDPTAANQAVGDFTAGLYLTNTTSLVNSLDYYNVQIWLTSGGNNVTQILDSGKICLDQNNNPNDGCINYPIGYDFNPPTSLYFYGLSATDKQNNRYRVRLTVHNQCGESYQESYFRVDPTCHGCLTAGSGDPGTLQEDGQTEERQSKIENIADVSVNVHPNPTDGDLYVAAVLSQEGIANFTLYNDGGQEVASFQQDMIGTSLNLNQSLNIESLPVGIYWWRFIANGQVRTGKVVKN